MPDKIIEIGAAGIDAEAIVREIEARVAEKKAAGCYTDARIARAERTNLANLKDEDGFLEFYLECLRDSVFVDINDFPIVERRSRFGSCLVALKTCIWKLLKFYTYRLWSQQNQVNGLLLSAIQETEKRHAEKLRDLERQVAGLNMTQKPDK